MKLYEVTFSPTGGTRRAADLLAAAWPQPPVQVDLTDRTADLSAAAFTAEDVVLIAVPSYGGRVPALAARRLAALHGAGARAVLVCVYGNRAYEDTLVELEDLARAAGFVPAGAVAAVAQHSIAAQYAAGRPDGADAALLAQFGETLCRRIQTGGAMPALPGRRPYKKAGVSGPVPMPGAGCTACGLCAAQCPAGAISAKDPSAVDKTLCISCMRCTAVCPSKVRRVNAAALAAVGLALKPVCSARKEPVLF